MVNKIKLFFISFLLTLSVVGQNSVEKVALSSLLISLEKTYDIKFSYSDADVNNIYIEQPEKGISIEKLIDFLNEKTFLQFKTLDNRYITVSFLNKTISICGTVLDKKYLEPLLLASIKVNGYKLGTTTNSHGIFHLKIVPVNTTLTISFIVAIGIGIVFSNKISKNSPSCISVNIEGTAQTIPSSIHIS